MAGTIQGLTVIINGDATALTKSMREARAEAGILKGHMSTLGRLLKFNPTNMTLLTRQQQLLNQAMRQTSQRLATMRANYAQLAPTVSTMSSAQLRQFESLQREITATELRMAELRAEAVRTGAAGSLAMQQWAARFGSVNAAMQAVSSRLMTFSMVSGLVGAAALKASVDFESSFAGVRKTIIATEAEYEKLAADAIALSLVKPVDVNDINRIMELGGQLNIASQYLTKFAGVMADLNVSTDMGVDEGSLKLAQFINITGMAQNDVDRLGATIVDLGNNSATTEDRMMNMAMRIAGAGSNLGMSAQNVLALAASLSAVGIQAEMGGNAIATVMNKINKDVALENSALTTWAQTAGMSAAEFKQSWSTDVTGTLLQIFKGMGEFRDEGNNLNLLLKDMGISYMRQVDTMQRLSRASDLTTTLMARSNVAWEQNTALVRESTQRYSTAESKMQLMRNSINAMGIALGNEVLPAFSGLVDNVAKAVQAFADMDDGTKELVVGIVAFVTVLGPASKAVELMSGGIAALLRGYMSVKTAIVLAAQGQLTYTNMVIASSAAQTGNTAALEANGIATVTNITLKDALSLAYTRVAVAAIDAAAAIGISTTALLGIVGAAALAVAAIAAIAIASAQANDPLDELSATYRDQQDRINTLQADYDALASSESATTEEIWKAQSALDEEKASLEANSVTIREFNENVERAAEEQAKMAEESQNAVREAEDQAGTIGRLVDDIREYAKAAPESAEATQSMLLAMSQLNMLVPELELSWDSATNSVKSSVSDWEDAANRAGRAAVNTKAQESLATWNDNLTRAQNDLTEATRNYEDAVRAAGGEAAVEYASMASGYTYMNSAVYATSEALNTAQASYTEASINQKVYSELVKATADREVAYTDVIGQVAAGKMTLADATRYLSDQYGIEASAQDIVNERSKRTAEAQKETSQSVSDTAEAIQKQYEKYPVFAAAMDRAGVSAENLAVALSETGVSAEDAAKAIEDYVTRATNGFEKLNADGGISLDEFLANLQHNADASVNFADNLAYLKQHAETPVEFTFIKALEAGDIENASVIVQQLVDDMENGGSRLSEAAGQYDEAFTRVSEAELRNAGATRDAAEAFNEVGEGAENGFSTAINAANEMRDNVAEALGQLVGDASAKGREAGEGVANGLRSSNAPSAARSLSQQIMEALKLGDTYSYGKSAMDGLLRGMQENQNKVISAAGSIASSIANGMSAALKINSPSKVTQAIGRGVDEGLVLGMYDYADRVRMASTSLAEMATPDVSSAIVAANAYPASIAPSVTASDGQGNVYNFYTTLDWRAGDDANAMADELAYQLRRKVMMEGR